MRAPRLLFWTLAFVVGYSRLVADEDVHQGTAIVLPPFLVEEHRISSLTSRLDWIYFNGDGLEVLSACPEDETGQFIRNLREQRAALRQFIPDDLLLRTSLPTTLILFPKTQKNGIDEQMVKEVERIPGASNSAARFTPIDDLRLSDPDSSLIFVVLDDWQWGWDIRHGYPKGKELQLFYTPPYLRFLVEARTPALPDWFTEGIIRLYQSIAINDATTGKISSAWAFPMISLGNSWQDSRFQADPWISLANATALREHGDAPRPLLPMQELFVSSISSGRSETYRRVWESEAELFVRWAFSDRIENGRGRLTKFVEAAAAQPVTENLFQSCFGMRYSDARDALSDFLPTAVRKDQLFAFSAKLADSESVELREATPQEILRIKGEWARRTLRVVQSSYPEAMPLYITEARNVLQGSYERGERDPQLVASLGLFRLDIGDIKGGRQLLEENPAAEAARPLASLELAKLHLNDALERPLGDNRNLSEEQFRTVLREVSETLVKQPPIEAAYVLATRMSKHLKRDPNDAERAFLNEGAQLFPRNSQMVMECVSWDIRANDFSSGRKLVELGEYESADIPMSEKFKLLDNLILKASASEN
jgi:hypothetical protein